MRTGEGLTLTCVVSGDEPDSITWFKDGALVVSASAVFEIQSNYDALTFTKVQFVCSKSCLLGPTLFDFAVKNHSPPAHSETRA